MTSSRLPITTRYCAGCGADLAGTGRWKWCSERCRRNTSYGGVCQTCGGPTAYSGDREHAHECKTCLHARRWNERKWTRESIVHALREYHRRTGERPNSTQWLQEGTPEGCPPVSTTQREFGRWNTAMAAAGFEIDNRPDCAESEERRVVIATLHRAGLTNSQIARHIGLGHSSVKWHLEQAAEEHA